MALYGLPYAQQFPWPTPGSFGAQLYESNPDAAFSNLMQQYGTAWGADPYSQTARSLSTRSQDAYHAAVPGRGLGYGYTQFLQEEFPHLFQGAYSNMSPSQRGQSSAMPGIGRARWVGF